MKRLYWIGFFTLLLYACSKDKKHCWHCTETNIKTINGVPSSTTERRYDTCDMSEDQYKDLKNDQSHNNDSFERSNDCIRQ